MKENYDNKQDTPLVSILLAVYNPNIKWLKEQLVSLNNQDYDNIELIIWDDCPDSPIAENIIKSCIDSFSYKLYKGEKNLGSNGAFSELTKLASGEYIAYCDQDDIWCENKLSVLVKKIENTKSVLVCSDVYIIDADGNKTANSISQVHKRHRFREGEGLAVSIFNSNFVMGCATLVKTEVAKKAVPFPREFVHDHWLAICAACDGKIEVANENLIYYRKHGENQTGVLSGIRNKNDYYQKRVVVAKKGIDVVKDRLGDKLSGDENFANLHTWIASRARYFQKPNLADFSIMGKYSYFSKKFILFEKVAPFIPNPIIRIMLKILQKGIVY